MIWTLFYFLLGLFGLSLGSFLNVLIDRLPTNEKISGRSYCPYCKKKLAWYELIPLLSFIFLKGKCSFCKKTISLQYPLVELATGILFIFTAHNLQLTVQEPQGLLGLFFLLCLVSCLIVIFSTDLKYYIVPDEVIYFAIGLTLCYQIYQAYTTNQFNNLFFALLSAIGAGMFFLFLFFLTKGKGMGFGDVKISAFMGIFLSFPKILVALFLAFFSGSVIGLMLVVLGKKTLKSKVPLGCFLAPATFVAFFWGEKIVDWYLNII